MYSKLITIGVSVLSGLLGIIVLEAGLRLGWSIVAWVGSWLKFRWVDGPRLWWH